MENVFDEMTITTEENERWKVTDLKTADYCFETLKSIEDKKAELKAFAEEKIQKVQQWLESELKPLEASEEHYKGLITEYYIEQKKLNNKFKLSTPSGKITQRTTKTLNYDEDTMLNYLEGSHSDLIQVVKKYSKNDVKKLIKADNGTIIDIETGEILNKFQGKSKLVEHLKENDNYTNFYSKLEKLLNEES